MEIKNFTAADYTAIAAIYMQGIATGIATFQTVALVWEDWDKAHLPFCRLVALCDGQPAGWAALSPVSARWVYRGVAEVSIYIAENFRGKGIGKTLLMELIKQSEEQGIWTLQSGIFAQNKASIHLHQQCGFREIGYREKIGFLNGRWYDNIIMEKRSTITGV